METIEGRRNPVMDCQGLPMDKPDPKGDAIRRRIAESCRKMSKTRTSNYCRVVLALYLTAEDDGGVNVATNGYIGELAGLTAATVGEYVRQAEIDRVVMIFRPGVDNLRCRVMVLLDHPRARAMVKNLEWQGGSTASAQRAAFEAERKVREKARKVKV